MFDWRNLLRGFAMGVTDLVPGISGSTIALMLGIYHKFVDALSGLMHPSRWKRSLLFLIPLGIGIGAALLTFSSVIETLLEHYPQPAFFFFFGIIVGIVPNLFKRADYKRSFRMPHYALLVVAAIAIALTRFIREDGLGTVIDALTPANTAFLFISGWLASAALILPGISGSFVMLLLGVYPTVIHALSHFKISILFVVGAGIAVGLLLTSKFVSYLLERFPAATNAAIIGLVGGSAFVVFPGFPSGGVLFVVSLVCFVFGFVLAIFLGKVEQKNQSSSK